jgi:hypothetical protein
VKPLIILASLAAFVVVAGSAAGAASPGGSSHGVAGPPSKKVSAKETRQSVAESIGKVIRDSKPLPTLVANGSRQSIAGFEGTNGPELRVSGKAGGLRKLAAVGATQNPNAQVGKLYFDTQPGPAVTWSHCTATAINTENKSFVLTAGHCVYNPDPDKDGIIQGGASRNGYWYENVQFCPGYDHGCNLGVWYARNLYTTNSWFYGTGTPARYDWSDDMAVVLVSRSATNGYLTDAVGGQGIDFNRPVGLYRTSFGYPAPDWRFPQYSYSGENLVYCNGYDSYDGAGHVVIGCTMTGGASGGPWIINANANWLGYVNSVNSHKPAAETMGGPYFDSTELNLFQYTRGR